MNQAPSRRPRLLLVSMYPLDRVDSGPTVRISNMRAALAELADLEVISGYRVRRSVALARYAGSGRLRHLDGIYVESSSFLPSPADLAFLGLARSLGIRVLTFIRDAYQLFPDYEVATAKRRIAQRLFMPALRGLMAVSSRVAFPSAGLAEAVGAGRKMVLLPPGAPAPVDVPRRPEANQLLYVGALGSAALGGRLLLAAVDLARAGGGSPELTCVTRRGEEPAGPHPDWLHLQRASALEIHALLPAVLACVIPRRRNAYNDLAIPVKLMEYLSYGRPLLVTDCIEQARIVERSGAGLVVEDSVESLADGIGRLFEAAPSYLDELSAAARVAAEKNSWHVRARRVVAVLCEGMR